MRENFAQYDAEYHSFHNLKNAKISQKYDEKFTIPISTFRFQILYL
jgi:hypothetical protein